jgi:NhaP-type Na+/H+ or K+/H+ antiporter
MHHDTALILTVVWSVGFGLLAQVLAHRWRIPAIVLLLLFGVVLGPNLLAIVNPSALGEGLSILVKLAVAVILFEGALNLRLSVLRSSVREVRNLVTLGALIAWVLTTLFSHFVAGLDWQLAILFGALMTVTGPTVVQPLLKRMDIPRRLKTILEGEAILIDPIGAILAVAVLDVVLGFGVDRSVGFLFALWSYFGRLLIGLLVGGLVAWVLSRLMKIPNLIPPELSNLVVLAGVWVAFGVAEGLQSEAGIMASVVMGLVLQREAVPGERQLRHFKETLTTLSISVLFVLLAANLNLDLVWAEGLPGVLTILLIMFVVRPLSVFISQWRSGLSWREKALIAWIGPRGIVAASVASLFGLTLFEVGIAQGERLPALTFLAIMLTVTIQGLTAPWVARLLNLHGMEGRRVVIVGANRLGRELAQIIQAHGRPITLVDTNQLYVDEALNAGLNAMQGNALDEYILEQSCIDEAETILAVTSNSEVNVLVSQFAQDVFGTRRTFPIINNPEKGADAKTLRHTGGKMGFGKPIDVMAWEYVEVQQYIWEVPKTWSQASLSGIEIPGELLPVARLREKSLEVVHYEQVWQPKDRIVFLTRCTAEEASAYLAGLAVAKLVFSPA